MPFTSSFSFSMSRLRSACSWSACSACQAVLIPETSSRAKWASFSLIAASRASCLHAENDKRVLYDKLKHFVVKQREEGKIRMDKWKHLNEIRGCHGDGCLLTSMSPSLWLHAGQYTPRLSELWWFADQWVLTLLECDDVLINRRLSFCNLIICWSVDT